ncbi:MAG TPA: hypothetical protein VIV60_16215 [Polyangiaceae bacterium]
MNDTAAPNQVEHLLLSYSAMETVQDLVDIEVADDGEASSWPEHWEKSGAIVTWKCPVCARLYLNAKGDKGSVVVYRVDKIGID